MAAPQMVFPNGDNLAMRNIVDDEDLYAINMSKGYEDTLPTHYLEQSIVQDTSEETDLPQCKIKRNYACNTCDYFTQNPRTYLHHLRDIHFEKIKIYECSLCLYASKHSQKLQRHIHMVHVMGAGKKKQGKSRNKAPTKILPVPMQSQVPVQIISTPSLPMLNNDSISNTDSDENPLLEDDLRISSPISQGEEGNEKQFRCSMCMFYSHNANLVHKHERVVHMKKKLFRCVKCNYVTHMKARFTKHVKYHSMPMIKCELCDFRTPYKWNLDRHWKNHTGEGAFKCSLCNFTADIKQSLTVHEMNHHIPAAGQATAIRRRNRVGGSDLFQDEDEANDLEEQEMIKMEREGHTSSDMQNDGEDLYNVDRNEVDNSDSDGHNLMNQQMNYNSDLEASNEGFFGQHNGLSTLSLKKFHCRVCRYKAALESEMRHHESHVHGLDVLEKKKARPIPNLIPIQGSSGNKNCSSPPLSSFDKQQDGDTLSDKDLNDIYAKSCPNSVLKDFASVIGGNDVFNTTIDLSMKDDNEKTNDSTNSNSSSENSKKTPDLFKKKNASFFDKLKEKLMTTTSTNETGNNLQCKYCEHVSKCLSEYILHQKIHNNDNNSSTYSNSNVNSNTSSPVHNGGSTSTRCQFCRQRCKSSSDLSVHLQVCLQALNYEEQSSQHSQSSTETFNSFRYQNEKENNDDEEDDQKPTSKVFIWNSLPCETTLVEDPPMHIDVDQQQPEALDFKKIPSSGNYDAIKEDSWSSKSPSESSLMGFETTPGYGSVTSKTKSGSHGHINPDLPPAENGGPTSDELTLKKVYKCPHCAFWASTASRFHVHIVGHLNKKPFECSLCAYRSNWRWDITKHIRLKTIRDPAHESAKVLMTDETGRRNYTKYNKYLTLMKVHEPNAESSGSGKRSNQQKIPNSPSSNQRMFQLQPNVVLNMSDTNPFKRPASSYMNDPMEEPQPKNSKKDNGSDSGGSKKTMWKCKKCLFRDGDRAVVLAHVKEHYRLAAINRQQEQDDSIRAGSETRSLLESRLSEPLNLENNNNNNNESDLNKGRTDDEDPDFVLFCEMCEFKTTNSSDYEKHLSVHYPKESDNNVSYRCYKCTFSSLSKSTLMDHLQTHGIQDAHNFFIPFDGRGVPINPPVITTEERRFLPYM